MPTVKILKHKFPQCTPATLETSCLLEIGDFSRKLRLRCSCQFPWCALAKKLETATQPQLPRNVTDLKQATVFQINMHTLRKLKFD
jgi:hypothetical protein